MGSVRVMRAAWGLGLAAVLVVASGGGGAFAQEETNEERLRRLEEKLDDQAKEIEELKERQRAAEAAPPPPPPPPPPPEKKPSWLPAHVGYKDGFFVESDDEKHLVKLGGRFQLDTRIYGIGERSDDTFLIRRARLNSSGYFFKHIEYIVEGDFAASSKPLRDAYVTLAYLPWLKLRAGQWKTPITLEQLASDLWIVEIERPLTQELVVDRDAGVTFLGNVAGVFHYWAGIVNGTGTNNSDTNDDKDFFGRIELTPGKPLEVPVLEGLKLCGAYQVGHQTENDFDQNRVFQNGSPRTFGKTRFLDFDGGADSASMRGRRELFDLGASLELGPVYIEANGLHARYTDLEKADERANMSVCAWYVEGEFVLTGEAREYSKTVRPDHPFSPVDGDFGLGALSIVARVEDFDADNRVLSRGIATGTDRVTAYSGGLTWYLNPMVRIMLNYVRSEFDDDVVVGGKEQDNEDLFAIRLQLAF